MKNIELKPLIDKYMAAETSLEEEKQLKERLLSGEDSNPDGEIKALFGYFTLQSAIEIPVFDNPAAVEEEIRTPRIIRMPWIAAAAAILIVIMAYMYFNETNQYFSEDTFSDPEMAAQNAAEALQMLSIEINKGKAITMEQMNDLDNINKYLTIY